MAYIKDEGYTATGGNQPLASDVVGGGSKIPQLGDYDAGGGGTPGINIDPEAYPWSVSQSWGSGGSSSKQGLNWDLPIVKEMVGPLTEQMQGLPDLIQAMDDYAYQRYQNLLRQGLGPDAFQGSINEMAASNMLNSSVMSDAMAKTASEVMKGIADKGFESALAAKELEYNLPTTIANILAALATESTSKSSQRQGAYSYEEDRSVPMSQLLSLLTSQQGQ